MPNIKPISDLRNYSEVLHDVAVGAPVFLTKNGRGRYAIVDMQDYERARATIRMMNELLIVQVRSYCFIEPSAIVPILFRFAFQKSRALFKQ